MMTQNNEDLKLENYFYDLPKSFIADRPILGRDTSKLLIYKAKSQTVSHDYFYNIHRYLPSDSTLVFNDSKVFPCRLKGHKESGGACEVFFLSQLKNEEKNAYHVLVRTNGRKNLNQKMFFDEGLIGKLIEREGDGTFWAEFSVENMESYLRENGEIPIPPYIRNGQSDEKDYDDYQTVYAKNIGSVAAPTAGLHFTPRVFENLDHKNIGRSFVSLHVGMGTFLPVKTESILEHKMHTECFFYDRENLLKIQNAKKLIAVGTTSLRALESSLDEKGQCKVVAGKTYETNIFIHPGVEVKSVMGLITNFHLPESSLLMLISALIGRKKVLELYHLAKENNYRFFSYGDCMLILREE